MKAKLLLLFVALASTAIAKSTADLTNESLDDLKMNNLIEQASDLTLKIKSSDNADSIKIYAKQLMSLSDEMESTINRKYNYKGIQTSYALLLTDPPAFGVVVNFPDNEPDELESAHLIWDGASNIRYFFSRNQDKLDRNLEKIELAIMRLKANY